MGLREERQEEFAQTFINSNQSGILYLSPRFGKCRVAIEIFQNWVKTPRILISYPDLKIKKSWEDEIEKMGYINDNIQFTTHISLKKYVDELYDLVVIDEIHSLSDAQTDILKKLKKSNRILGLTGTMSKWTEKSFKYTLNLPVLARYSISEAIQEGVITDYEIYIKKVVLDNKMQQTYKTGVKTEKEQFDAYSFVIKKMEKNGGDTKFLRMSRMRLIQASRSKICATKEILTLHNSERILVFCGQISSVEALGIPTYHSKSKEKQDFEEFSKGMGNHLGVVKIGRAGITYKPLDMVIINYFDSNPENLAQKINRCMAMEYSNPGKKAIIYIVTTNEEVELKWLNNALAFFDVNKIKYI